MFVIDFVWNSGRRTMIKKYFFYHKIKSLVKWRNDFCYYFLPVHCFQNLFNMVYKYGSFPWVHGNSALRMACTSSATAIRQNSNWGLVCTMPLRWSLICSKVAAMSISLQPLAILFKTISIKTYVPDRPTPSLKSFRKIK